MARPVGLFDYCAIVSADGTVDTFPHIAADDEVRVGHGGAALSQLPATP
jgi:hypothetical protein|eukprot:COSAG01_NODE_622_length_14779_cov_69.589305_15_plen_49_part_00